MQETGKTNKAHIVSPQEQLRVSLYNQYRVISASNRKISSIIGLYNSDILLPKFSNKKINIIPNNYYQLPMYNIHQAFNALKLTPQNISKLLSDQSTQFSLPTLLKFGELFQCSKELKDIEYSSLSKLFKPSLSKNIIKDNYIKLIKHEDFDEYSRWVKRNSNNPLPIRIIKYPLVNNNTDLFKFRFNSNINKLEHKVVQDSIYLTLKQKRYNRKKIVSPQVKYFKDNNSDKTNVIRYSGKPYLSNNKLLKVSLYDQTIQYKLIKKNKKKGELISVTLARRLLRTKKTLVLPAHVNLTLITNSYDIVHSWFIPGLGIKLDCVPGRSTHHTFFIDNVGFYYGQCAEICGRYHHHMPIRICALPFEHFLL